MSISPAAVSSSVSILIETYWNVNLLLLLLCHPDFFILIETYWNVNRHKNQ